MVLFLLLCVVFEKSCNARPKRAPFCEASDFAQLNYFFGIDENFSEKTPEEVKRIMKPLQ